LHCNPSINLTNIITILYGSYKKIENRFVKINPHKNNNFYICTYKYYSLFIEIFYIERVGEKEEKYSIGVDFGILLARYKGKIAFE